MNNEEVIAKLTDIFRTVFEDSNLVLRNEMTANDVDNWDSLTHMVMITQVEKSFGIKFKLKELNKMKKVGDLLSIIETRI